MLKHRQSMLMLCALLMVCVLVPTVAFATEASSAFDGSDQEQSSFIDDTKQTGNLFVINQDNVESRSIDADLYWAGNILHAQHLQVGASGSGDLLAAGAELYVRDTNVSGSLRLAGKTIEVTSTQVSNNITVAGADISLDANTCARGLYAAGATISAAGTYEGGALAGSRVTFSGTCNGNVSLQGNTITVTRDAVVKGILTVPENCELTIEDGASIGQVIKAAPANDNAEQNTDLIPFGSGLWFALVGFSLVAHCILALLFLWVARRPIERMAQVTHDHFTSVCFIGVAAFLLMPLVLIVLMIPLVTIPVVVLLLIMMITTWLFAIPLAGCAIGVRVGKGKRPYVMGLISTIVLTLLCWIPGMFLVVPSVCAAYLAGCFIQMFYLYRQSKKHQPLPVE